MAAALDRFRASRSQSAKRVRDSGPPRRQSQLFFSSCAARHLRSCRVDGVYVVGCGDGVLVRWRLDSRSRRGLRRGLG